MSSPSSKRRARPSEEGYVLVAVIFMMAILILSLAVAVPKVRQNIQRDRDEETMERGKQYIRAIQLYYRKFHAYPPNVDALVKTDNIRFLRKKYIDPTTGKDEWKPILFGQNKTPKAMGFFGQPLAGATLAGIGPAGGNINGTSGMNPGGGGLFNSTPATGATSTSTTTTTGTSDQSGTTGSGTTTPTGTPAAPGPTTAGPGTTSNPIGSGQTFGGGGIIGFSPQGTKQSILIYKKKNHYNEWEFLYDPIMDQQMMGGSNVNTGMPNGSNPANNFGPTTTPAPTNPPTSPTTPTSPQQPQQQ